MTAALSPALALRYLAELDPAIEAAAVVDADGVALAGDLSLAAGARGSAGLLVARAAYHSVLARVGPDALEGLIRHDLEAVVRELG